MGFAHFMSSISDENCDKKTVILIHLKTNNNYTFPQTYFKNFQKKNVFDPPNSIPGFLGAPDSEKIRVKYQF